MFEGFRQILGFEIVGVEISEDGAYIRLMLKHKQRQVLLMVLDAKEVYLDEIKQTH